MNKIGEYVKKYDILIFIALGFLLYFPALYFNFIIDDIPLILNNEYLNGSSSISFFDFFIPKFVRKDIYIPFTFIIYWLISKFFGANAFVFHFVDIFFYLSSSIALFYLLKRIINNYSIVFFAVILYLLHPCHIECTAWISAMGYNISALFFYLSFLFFIIAFDEDKKVNYIYSILFYIFAILSQPIAVTLPAILFLWVFCFRRDKLKESVLFIFSYVPFLLIYLFLFKNTVSNSYRFSEFIAHSFIDKILTVGHYIFNSFFPFYLQPYFVTTNNNFYLFCSIIGLLLLFFLMFRRDKFFLFFIGFYIISLLPYLGIFFENLWILSDRYLCIAVIPSSVCISYFCIYFFTKFSSKILLKNLIYIFFLISYLFSFLFYIPIWKNDVIFWNYSYSQNSDNIFCMDAYGSLLFNQKKYIECSLLADKMIQKYPELPFGYRLKLNSLMALKKFDDGLIICSNFFEKMQKKFDNYLYEPCIYFFDIYINLRQYDKALESLKLAEEKCKEYSLLNNLNMKLFFYERYYHLANVYLQTNRQDKVKEICEKMLEINPNDEKSRELLDGLGNKK